MGAFGRRRADAGLQGGIANFSHRGYNMCANLLRTTLPERGIQVRLNPDAVFEFPYGDGYWSKLLNRTFSYEDELELLFSRFRRHRLHAARLRRQLRLLVGAGLEQAVRFAQGDRDRTVRGRISRSSPTTPTSTATVSKP